VLNRIIQIRLRTELLGLGGMSRGPRAVVVVVLFDPGEDVAEPVEDASAHAKAAWAAALASFEAQGCDGQAGEVGGFGDREQPIVLIVRVVWVLVVRVRGHSFLLVVGPSLSWGASSGLGVTVVYRRFLFANVFIECVLVSEPSQGAFVGTGEISTALVPFRR
jgi:hypothetical protein